MWKIRFNSGIEPPLAITSIFFILPIVSKYNLSLKTQMDFLTIQISIPQILLENKSSKSNELFGTV